MAMKKKTGARSTMRKKMAGKRGTIATAKRSGSSKAMKALRAAAKNGGGELGGGGGQLGGGGGGKK
jgi:hypothetical protein